MTQLHTIGLGSVAIGWLEGLRELARYRCVFDVACGLTLIAAGLFMLNADDALIPELAA